MSIEIGQIIKGVLKAQGRNHKDLAILINRHPKTVANILKRKTMDTDLLRSISRALVHDFFSYYYKEEPLKTFREVEMKGIVEEIAELKRDLHVKNEFIKTQDKYVQSQEDVIRLLKEKEQFLNR
jgi:hypothetical protein